VNFPRYIYILLFITTQTIAAYGQQATTVPAGQPVLLDGIVAVVNDDIILHSEVMLMVREAMRANKLDPQMPPDEFERLFNRTVNSLINIKVEVAKAVEDTLVQVDEAEVESEVDARIDNLIQELGSEQAIEAAFGSSVRRIRDLLMTQIRDQMLVSRLRQRRMSDVTISRFEIEEFFEAYRDSLPEQPDLYDVSHILKTPKPSGPLAVQKKAFLDSLRQLIVNGADFGDLARQYSEDPGSKDNGGAYDWVPYGTFVPEFEDAVRELNKNETSEVIQSNFGYHLIQVLDKRSDSFRARHILLMQETSDEDVEALIDSLNILRDKALAGESFEDLSAKHSDEDQVRADRGKIGAYSLQQLETIAPEFATAVKTLEPGEISKPFKTPFGYDILKLNRFIPAHRLNLTDDYERIKDITLQQKSQRLYQEFVMQAKSEMYIAFKNTAIADSTKGEIK